MPPSPRRHPLLTATKTWVPASPNGPWIRLLRTAAGLRLAVSLATLATAWISDDVTLSARITFTVLVLGVMVPYSLYTLSGQNTVSVGRMTAITVSDLGAVFIVQLLFFEVVGAAVLFVYLLTIAVTATYTDRAWIFAAIGAISLNAIAQMIVGGDMSYTAFTDAIFVVAAFGVGAIIDAVTRERRQQEVFGLAALSHEMRTPLTSIQGFTQTLMYQWERLDDRERKDFLERISRNAGSLSEQIEAILDLARSKDEVPSDVSTGVRAEIDQVLLQTRSIIGAHPISVIVPGDVYVVCDPMHLNRIITNLLSNAAKYSPEGNPIAVGSRDDSTRVVLWVKDWGKGIPEQELQRIFEPFARGEVRARESTGVGLALVRRYAQLQGGSAWVESNVGEGSTFYVSLPRARMPDSQPRSLAG